MRYSKNYQMLICDTDINDNVSPSAVFRYLQDAACSNMAEGHPSYKELYDIGYTFVLSRITINLYKDIHAGDNIKAESWAVPSKGYIYGRDFVLYRDGIIVAEAVSEWALLGVSDRKPHPVNEVSMNYGEDAPLDMRIPRFRISDENLSECGTHTVTYADCDINGHMNNTRYPDIMLGCTGDMHGRKVKSLTVCYKSEAPLGCNLTLLGTEDCGSYFIRSVRDDGIVNAECSITFEGESVQ